MKSSFALALFTALFISVTLTIPFASAKRRHVINFLSPNLYPESLTHDPKSHHFIVGGGTRHHHKLLSVSDAGVTETLISDTSLPENSSFLGLCIDHHHHRILACIHRIPTLTSPSPFNALAAYDLNSGSRIFLTPLLDNEDQNPIATVTEKLRPATANDVTVDLSGNAYVTNSDGDFIWKVNVDGDASILSRSEVFKSHPVDVTVEYHKYGLNGVVYISNKEYLLVVQSNTGKMYKVNVNDGTTKTVILDKDLTAANGMAVKSDGVVVVMSQHNLYYVKSEDNWESGTVFDEIALDEESSPTAVTVGDEDGVYLLYGHVMKGITGNENREEFRIVEVEEENKEDNAWLIILVCFGLAYFLFWRFQMRRLVQNMDKRIA